MTGVWRGFFLSKRRLATRFRNLTADDQTPLDIERGPLLGKEELAKEYPKLIPEQTIPLNIQRNHDLGLHGGKHPMVSYNVTRTNKKMYRLWRPHILIKSFYSELLDYTFTVPISTHAIREIERMGSLDAYILYTPQKSLGGRFAIDFHNKLLEVIENNLDVVLPPRIKHYPRPPVAILEKVTEAMDKAKEEAVKRNAHPDELIQFDYSSMAS